MGPLARRGANPSAVSGTPVAEEQAGLEVPLEDRGHSERQPEHRVQCEARRPGVGCHGDGGRGYGGSTRRGDDGHLFRSGGEGLCRRYGDGRRPRGHGGGRCCRSDEDDGDGRRTGGGSRFAGSEQTRMRCLRCLASFLPSCLPFLGPSFSGDCSW
ncbi:uncharacterized protein LOC123451091 [Hordeum vulgare subsp. vulgare]|uniref:uncharacterized protein LOC123451091 n=1 Tax=Hordeum vulgare subsp. vulgare TaxID=112509 RepID=UPI001D1A3E8E|nr:uncharacterized protein LOC123451091 [Hordeum vulgare subsp. vulgare]